MHTYNMLYGSAKPGIRTSVLISPEFYDLCKKHHIKFSEAMRVGIGILLGERGEVDYDNKLNLVRALQEYKLKAANALQKISDLENETR